MKIILLTLAVLAAVYSSNAAPNNNVGLRRDLMDFMLIMPMGQIQRLSFEHLDSDLEYQAALKYMQTKEWQKMIMALHSKPSSKEIKLIIQEAGFDVDILERFAKMFLDGLSFNVAEGQKRSFGKFIAELNDIIPYEKLMDLLADKLENSASFKKFYDDISSERMYNLVNKVVHSHEFENVAGELMFMDVPVIKIMQAIYALFNWKQPHAMPNQIEE